MFISDCTRAIEFSDKDEVIYTNRGLSYEGLADYERAAADFRRALEINPNYQIAKDSLERVLKKDEIIIDKDGEPSARLIPIKNPNKKSAFSDSELEFR